MWYTMYHVCSAAVVICCFYLLWQNQSLKDKYHDRYLLANTVRRGYMNTANYPACCSVQVVTGMNPATVKAGVKELQGLIKTYHKNACALTAITNISQRKGIEALRAVGFTRSRKLQKSGVEKGAGTYNKIYIWYFELTAERVKKALEVKV